MWPHINAYVLETAHLCVEVGDIINGQVGGTYGVRLKGVKNFLTEYLPSSDLLETGYPTSLLRLMS